MKSANVELPPRAMGASTDDRAHEHLQTISFNRPYMTGNELPRIGKAHANFMLAGDGPFTKICHEWLERTTARKRRC